MWPEFKYNFISVQSVIIASVASDIALRAVMGQSPDIQMRMLPTPPLTSLWVFLIFGFLFGIFGVVFNRLLVRTLDFFYNLKGPMFTYTGLYVGAFIGLLVWLYPDLVGGGYQVIPRALSGTIPVTMLLLLFFGRFGTTMISYGSGAPGGIFAPMLALGTLFGMWYGNIAHSYVPDLVVRVPSFSRSQAWRPYSVRR